MSEATQQPSRNEPNITLVKTPDYRSGYANSVQVRPSVWDFALVFGTLNQTGPDTIEVENFQGIYLSPQQAKALHALLGQNLAQYEGAFGTISLDAPRPEPQRPGANGPRPVQ